VWVGEVEGETECGSVLVQDGTDVDRTLRDWLRMWVGRGHKSNETVPLSSKPHCCGNRQPMAPVLA
jgi:hypothetical protein